MQEVRFEAAGVSQSFLGEPKKYVVLVLGKEGVDRDQRQTKAVQNMGPEVSRDGGMTGKTVRAGDGYGPEISSGKSMATNRICLRG